MERPSHITLIRFCYCWMFCLSKCQCGLGPERRVNTNHRLFYFNFHALLCYCVNSVSLVMQPVLLSRNKHFPVHLTACKRWIFGFLFSAGFLQMCFHFLNVINSAISYIHQYFLFTDPCLFHETTIQKCQCVYNNREFGAFNILDRLTLYDLHCS